MGGDALPVDSGQTPEDDEKQTRERDRIHAEIDF
jgi:hypothetical protein